MRLHYGGAVRNRAGANLTMRRCVLSNNNSGGGGGLSNAGGLVLQESQILSNTAPIGGGLQSTGSAPSGIDWPPRKAHSPRSEFAART